MNICVFESPLFDVNIYPQPILQSELYNLTSTSNPHPAFNVTSTCHCAGRPFSYSTITYGFSIRCPSKLKCHTKWEVYGYLLLWKGHPLKCSGFPVDLPMPFSPVQSARKFSAVLGVISANSSRTIRPTKDRKQVSQTSVPRMLYYLQFITLNNTLHVTLFMLLNLFK